MGYVYNVWPMASKRPQFYRWNFVVSQGSQGPSRVTKNRDKFERKKAKVLGVLRATNASLLVLLFSYKLNHNAKKKMHVLCQLTETQF
jgi:hypothetical protein